MTIRIRPAIPDDGDVLTGLVDGLNEHVGAATGGMTREVLLRDAFGENARFSVLVAERAGAVAGYAACCDAYETEHAMPGLYMIDLYVDPDHRRNGIARRLIAAVSAAARAKGYGFIWWTADPRNAEAEAFYRTIGSHAEPMVAHALFGAPFETLADEA